MEEARRMVAASMQQRMGVDQSAGGAGESFASLRAQLPEPSHFFYKTLEVFRGLLAVEERPDRFARLLRIWTGKIAAAVRREEFRRAELWLRAATDQPTYSSEQAPEVEQALVQLGTPEVLDVLVGELAEGREGESQSRLLRALGPPAVDSLVQLLAGEEDAARRRSLMDVLTVAAGNDPQPVLDHLEDDRWYVVRNLAIVLGRIGRAEVGSALVALLRHADHRVRVETLRALPPTMGTSALPHLRKALDDPHERVRQTAIGLLGAGRGEEALTTLTDALDSSRLDASEKRRVVELLAGSDSPTARLALTGLAARRFLVSSAKRQIRDAAREALAGRSAS